MPSRCITLLFSTTSKRSEKDTGMKVPFFPKDVNILTAVVEVARRQWIQVPVDLNRNISGSVKVSD